MAKCRWLDAFVNGYLGVGFRYYAFLDNVSACINANFDRYFTRKKAQLHGITGWCRNTTDSNV